MPWLRITSCGCTTTVFVAFFVAQSIVRQREVSDCRFDLLTRGQLQRPGPASGELDGMTSRLQHAGNSGP
jgi:hypothetical protein